MGTSTSVIVQDRSAFFRSSLAAILDAEPTITVDGVVMTSDELVEAAATAKPGAVFLEVQGTPWEVEGLLDDLHEASPSTRLIGVGRPADRSRLSRLHGRPLPRTAPYEDFIEALGLAPTGPVGPSTVYLTGETQTSLTEREHRVLSLLGAGWTADQIASRLGISARSVRSAREQVLMKLDVQSRAEAVAEALRLGIIGPPQLP